MSLYFPNLSQSLEAQPSLTVPSEVSLHTFINAKVGVPTSSQQCCDSARCQEELLHMYKGLGCSCSEQYLFFQWDEWSNVSQTYGFGLHRQASLCGLY